MMTRNIIWTTLFLIVGLHLNGQTLGYKDFLRQLENHPVAKQASIQTELGEANLRLQSAVTDPYVQASYGDKAYDDKDYYTKSSFKLALPTAIGAEFYMGYVENLGPQVDPEIVTTDVGQYQAGVNLPIGPDLIFNERRLAIQQAKNLVDAAEAERRIRLNELYFRASLAYLNWSLADQLVEVQASALELAVEQFNFVKSVFQGGDRPAIDTVEAFLQVQTRTFQLLEAERMLNGSEILISNFLWDPEGNMVRLAENISPESLADFDPFIEIAQDSFSIWRDDIVHSHPLLLQNRLEIKNLELKRRTVLSSAVPQLDLKYGVLTPGLSNDALGDLGINDRMLSVGIKYPLLIRKQRSKLSLNKLKTIEKAYDLDVKSNGLTNKMDQNIMEFGINSSQAQLYERMVQNFDRLLRAERVKFASGESSAFLLNSRENKLFEAQVKSLETKSKQIGSVLKVIQTSNTDGFYNGFIGQ